MKKLTLLIAALIIFAASSSAQTARGTQADTAVNFITAYPFYTDAQLFNDTASKVAVKVFETLNAASFQWSILTAKNKSLRTGNYICAGSCFTLWSGARSAYNEAVIVSDTAFKGLHPIQ